MQISTEIVRLFNGATEITPSTIKAIIERNIRIRSRLVNSHGNEGPQKTAEGHPGSIFKNSRTKKTQGQNMQLKKCGENL